LFFSKVDHNVSRHLTREYFQQSDWDLTILHYLGLDHIGHMEGPTSGHVRPKLDEMGKIIEKIKENLFEKFLKSENDLPPLILVLGDHGMADVGGHGGATPSEILVPLVAISPNIAKHLKVFQSFFYR
jgi:ethanolaminephosphotransferase